MLKLKLVSVGRPKEAWIEEGVDEYRRRLRHQIEVESIWVKDNGQLESFLEKETDERVLCLDPKGKQFVSETLADFLWKKFTLAGSRLVLVIGGAEGLPEDLRKRYSLLSLSKLTLTHQMTRLLFVEQLYRASEIKKGTGYHK